MFRTKTKKRDKKRYIYEENTHHKFRFDHEVFVPPYWNVFLHQAEVVEAAQKQPTAVNPQIKVHLLTGVPANDSKVK